MAEDATGTTEVDATTDTGDATDSSTSADTGAATLAEIKALADELGITPGQLKGRLDASKKWEQRAKQNTTAAQAATEQAQTAQQQLAAVAKALGLAEDETPDPAQLQAALAERDEIVRDMQRENAAKEIARTVGADPDLIKILTYDGKLDDLDPDDADFHTQLAQIISAELKSNPKYRSDAAFPDLRQGNQGSGAAASNDPNAWLRHMAGRQ